MKIVVLVPMSFEPLELVLLHALVLVPGSKVMLVAEVEKETKQLICAVAALLWSREKWKQLERSLQTIQKIVNDDLLFLEIAKDDALTAGLAD